MTKVPRLGDRALALTIGALVVVVLYLTSSKIGYARDEGGYWQASGIYGRWLELLWAQPEQALTENAVNDHFRVNAEHPALMKLLFALSRLILHQWLHLIPTPGLALRFPAMLMAGLATGLIVHWGSRAVSRPAGVVAGLLFITMPRVFHHAHLACFDVPVVAMLLLTTYAYFRAVTTRAWTWTLATGICYGLALDTKHNAWTLPAVLLVHLGLTEGRAFKSLSAGERCRSLMPLLSMLTLGPLVLFLLWPWLWYGTLDKLRFWVEFHLRHDYYNMEFLGRTYHRPPMPRAYAWVMTAATVPFTTLLLSLLGLFVSARHALRNGLSKSGEVTVWQRDERLEPATQQAGGSINSVPTTGAQIARSIMAPARWDLRRSNELLWLLGLLAAYAPWLLSTTPIFGGTKHWLPAYPFICLFAARGYALFLGRLREQFGQVRARPWRWRVVSSAATIAWLSAPFAITADSLGFGLTAYTPIVGGAPGAATLGLNRTFWGYTTLEVVDSMSQLLPDGGRVYVHDTALQSWDIYQRDGTIPRKLTPTLNIAQSDIALYHHEPHMGRVEYQIWEAYGTTSPEVVTTFDGVPVSWLYARPSVAAKHPLRVGD